MNGSMSRDYNLSPHGKDYSELQHKKNKKCNVRIRTGRKLRWNKKKGILENSKKSCRTIISMWSR